MPKVRARTLGPRPDRFQVVRPIGSGGMGIVYEAIDLRTGSSVALKELPALSADGLYRFKREFRTLKDVHHPNLVSLLELYEDAGSWFYTMELVPGTDLVSWIRPENRASSGAVTLDGPPPPCRPLALARGLAGDDAVAEAPCGRWISGASNDFGLRS